MLSRLHVGPKFINLSLAYNRSSNRFSLFSYRVGHGLDLCIFYSIQQLREAGSLNTVVNFFYMQGLCTHTAAKLQLGKLID